MKRSCNANRQTEKKEKKFTTIIEVYEPGKRERGTKRSSDTIFISFLFPVFWPSSSSLLMLHQFMQEQQRLCRGVQRETLKLSIFGRWAHLNRYTTHRRSRPIKRSFCSKPRILVNKPRYFIWDEPIDLIRAHQNQIALAIIADGKSHHHRLTSTGIIWDKFKFKGRSEKIMRLVKIFHHYFHEKPPLSRTKTTWVGIVSYRMLLQLCRESKWSNITTFRRWINTDSVSGPSETKPSLATSFASTCIHHCRHLQEQWKNHRCLCSGQKSTSSCTYTFMYFVRGTKLITSCALLLVILPMHKAIYFRCSLKNFPSWRRQSFASATKA